MNYISLPTSFAFREKFNTVKVEPTKLKFNTVGSRFSIHLNEPNNLMLSILAEELWQREYFSDTKSIIEKFLIPLNGVSLEKKFSDFENGKTTKQLAVVLDQWTMNVGDISKADIQKLHSSWVETQSELGYSQQVFSESVSETFAIPNGPQVIRDVTVQNPDGTLRLSDKMLVELEKEKQEAVLDMVITTIVPKIVEKIAEDFEKSKDEKLPEPVKEFFIKFMTKEFKSKIPEAANSSEPEKVFDLDEKIIMEKLAGDLELYELLHYHGIELDWMDKEKLEKAEEEKQQAVTTVAEAVVFTGRQKRLMEQSEKRKSRHKV